MQTSFSMAFIATVMVCTFKIEAGLLAYKFYDEEDFHLSLHFFTWLRFINFDAGFSNLICIAVLARIRCYKTYIASRIDSMNRDI